MIQEVIELKESLRKSVKGRKAVYMLHQTKTGAFLNLMHQKQMNLSMSKILVGPNGKIKEVTSGFMDLNIYRTD